jgi:soluble lytic murein transglycosylase-like protein
VAPDAIRNSLVRFIAAIAILALLIALTPITGSTADSKGVKGSVDEHALFRAVGAMYGLDPELLEAIAMVESGGRPDAVSPKGAVGLMQLMPATAAHYQVRDAYDPVQNALGAARYLTHLKEVVLPQGSENSEGLSRILAAYNAGEGAVWQYDGIPPFPETQDYVGRVIWVYLMGSTPLPAGARHFRAADSHATSARTNRHNERNVLDELDSIRRERESAASSTSE